MGIDRNRQLDSLRAVYYRGGALPPDPSAAEIASLRQLKAMPDLQAQAALLDKAFRGDERLEAIAIRDRDGDAIKDYRVTRCGEFRENDPDADCDGVANVLDSAPYDAVATPGSSCGAEPDWRKVTNDGNGNGLPDQIDWRLLDASRSAKRPAAVQEGLYKDYGIVLVDRRKRMPAAVATDLDHVIRELFRGRVTPDFAPLRVITTDLSICGDGDTYGWASPESSTVFFMPEATKLKPVMRLEVLAHELTHTVQYDMDFSPDDVRGYRTQNLYTSVNFLDFAKSLDWTVVAPAVLRPPYALVVWQCADDDASPTLAYRGKPPGDWQEAWDRFEAAERQANHMVDFYAFSDAWEWHAEYSAAYVLNELLHAAGRICTLRDAASLRRRLRKDMTDSWDYHHDYAIGLPAYDGVVARQFHVDDETWNALARRFLLASYPAVCR